MGAMQTAPPEGAFSRGMGAMQAMPDEDRLQFTRHLASSNIRRPVRPNAALTRDLAVSNVDFEDGPAQVQSGVPSKAAQSEPPVEPTPAPAEIPVKPAPALATKGQSQCCASM
jgi:hypothetical protein